MPMHLVEQHVIRKSDPRYAKIDEAAFASKAYTDAKAEFVADALR